MTQNWKKAEIQELLSVSDLAVCRAILRIYEAQTEHEKSCKTTQEDNGVGFSAFDAEILSSFAEQLAKKKQYGIPLSLTPKQMPLARKRVKKYWKQLMNHAASAGRQFSPEAQAYLAASRGH